MDQERIAGAGDAGRAADRAGLLRDLQPPTKYENDANGNWWTTDMDYGWDMAIEAAVAALAAAAPVAVDVERLTLAVHNTSCGFASHSLSPEPEEWPCSVQGNILAAEYARLRENVPEGSRP